MQNLAVILAGGKGSRMKRQKNKVLEKICGQPIILYLIDKLKKINIKKIFVVVGYGYEEIVSLLRGQCEFVFQKEQLGTGDACRLACENFTNFTGNVLLLNGDGPIVSKSILKEMLNLKECDAKILIGKQKPNSKYGRVIRNENGTVYKIVEARDCTLEQLEITETNLGIYCFKNAILQHYVANLSRNNAQNEYYVTDLVQILNNNGYSVEGLKLGDEFYLPSVNTLEELGCNEEKMKLYINAELAEKGTRIIDIKNTYIDYTAAVGNQCTIYPNVFLVGTTRVGDGVTIEPNCYIKDCVIQDNAVIRANSVLIDKVIKN